MKLRIPALRISTLNLLLPSLLLVLCAPAYAQSGGVGINSTGEAPDPSALLDVRSDSKGALIPRMSTEERNGIATACNCSPAEGLMIFNTDTKCIEIFVEQTWAPLACPDFCSPPPTPSEIYGNTSICPWAFEYYYTDDLGAETYTWTAPPGATIVAGQGSNSVAVSFGENGGELKVRAKNGLCSSETVVLNILFGGPAAVEPSSGSVTATSITWNWQSSQGATGYRCSESNDFNSAIDVGASTTYTQTGLSLGTAYFLYVWAYNDCGYSDETLLVESTSPGCPNAWDIVADGGPSARHHHSLTWDPQGERFLLFGGRAGGVFKNDLWSYNPNTDSWTELSPTGTLPAIRDGHVAVWDSQNQRLLVHAGGNMNFLSDLWAYTPATNSWSQLAGSVANGLHAGVWDNLNNRYLTFGGTAGNTLRAYNPGTNSWTTLSPSGTTPPTRLNFSAVWNPSSSSMIIFGGQGAGNVHLSDIWMYSSSSNSWSQLNPPAGPGGRSGYSAAWDSSNSRLIIYGGNSNLNDLWAYSPSSNSWTMLNPTGALPTSRWNSEAAWNGVESNMLLFGGYSFGATDLGDTWEYCP